MTSPATATVEIVNARGLHARAAAKFAKCAEAFAAEIEVGNARDRVSGRSIMGLLLLAAAQGSTVTISAVGADAEAAIAALADLVARGFDET